MWTVCVNTRSPMSASLQTLSNKTSLEYCGVNWLKYDMQSVKNLQCWITQVCCTIVPCAGMFHNSPEKCLHLLTRWHWVMHAVNINSESALSQDYVNQLDWWGINYFNSSEWRSDELCSVIKRQGCSTVRRSALRCPLVKCWSSPSSRLKLTHFVKMTRLHKTMRNTANRFQDFMLHYCDRRHSFQHNKIC
jgi:hypothetical protein